MEGANPRKEGGDSLSDLARQCEPVPLVSVAECRKLEQDLMDSGVSALILMEQAALGLKDRLLRCLSSQEKSRKVLILCGPGNNGGDGLALARLLAQENIFAKVVLINSERYSAECLAQLKMLPKNLSLQVYPDADNLTLNAQGIKYAGLSAEQLADELQQAEFLVDALLGIGQVSEPRGPIAEVLELLSRELSANCYRFAIDVPTGINCDTGEVYKGAFVADLCVCLGALKRGLTQYPARSLVNKLSLVDLGFRLSAAADFYLSRLSIEDEKLLKRDPKAHKGSFGRVAIIGGSADYPGAPVLAANSAVLSGAGLVKKIHLPGWAIPGLMPEVMLRNASSNSEGDLGPEHLEQVLELVAESNAAVLGPGLGQSKRTFEFLSAFFAKLNSTNALVVDADALNFLAASAINLPKFERLVLTPHPGEAARLLNCSVADVEKDRFAAVKSLQSRYGGTVLLKGASSLVYSGEYGSGLVNVTGSSSLATGGSGDRLSGMIAALLARGLEASEATRVAVFVHGALSEKMIERPWF